MSVSIARVYIVVLFQNFLYTILESKVKPHVLIHMILDYETFHAAVNAAFFSGLIF